MPRPQAANGYASDERVIEHARRAGFELTGRSQADPNLRCTHDHPNGVWTLSPDLAVREPADGDAYHDTGESDRFTLRFVKPE